MNFGAVAPRQDALNGCNSKGFDLTTTRRTIIQYNYCRDDARRFVLLFTDQSPHRAVVRYNLSVDPTTPRSARPPVR